MKKKKTAALTKIVQEYVTLFGKEMEIKANFHEEAEQYENTTEN